eukprot:jgi/Chrpa1/18847/Chrysochromulina_OHIO_Genome00025747-RA
MRQMIEAEALAKLGETIVSPEAWALVRHACQGEPCEVAATPSASTVSLGSTASKGTKGSKLSPSKGGTPMRLVKCDPVDAPELDADKERLRSALLCKHLNELRAQQTHVSFPSAHRPFLQASLEAYVHETARKAIKADANIELSEIAERRVVVVGFGRVRGLDAALENGSSGLREVQSCLATCLKPISQSGALLRQFIYDDKGVVLIWTCEYGVMGPSVNLAARLMCMCAAKGVNLLCCDQMRAELTKGRVKDVRFTSYDPVAVRGYAALVGIHHVVKDEALMDMTRLLEHVQIYALLTPREQSKFLDAVVMRTFDTGEDLIVEGDAAEHFFILMDGTVHVTKRAADGSTVVLVPELKRGDSFGEVALITEGKRTATITATSPVVAMTISRSVFIDLFGGMVDLLQYRREKNVLSSPNAEARRGSFALPDPPSSLPTRLTRSSSTDGAQTPDSPKSLSPILERRDLSPTGWSAHASLDEIRGQTIPLGSGGGIANGGVAAGVVASASGAALTSGCGAGATMVPSPTPMPMAATALPVPMPSEFAATDYAATNSGSMFGSARGVGPMPPPIMSPPSWAVERDSGSGVASGSTPQPKPQPSHLWHLSNRDGLPQIQMPDSSTSSPTVYLVPSSAVPPSPGMPRRLAETRRVPSLDMRGSSPSPPGGRATDPAFRSSNGIVDKFVTRSVGRETEARLLANRVEAFLATGEPSLTLMTGEPGIGKSHLLRELRRLCGESDLQAVHAEGRRHDMLQVFHAEGRRHDMEPLSVWVPLLQAMLAAHLQVPVEHVQFSEALDMVPPALRGYVGHLASLLDGAAKGTVRRRRPSVESEMTSQSPARVRSLGGSTRHLEVECEMAVKIASHLMSLRPQLLLIDAAENLTPYAWQVLSGVLAAAPSVAVIVSSRDMNTWSNGGASEELSRLRRRCMAPNVSATCRISPTLAITELQLVPFSQDATRALLAHALSVRPESLDNATVAKAHVRCGGNPGFLLEFCTPDIHGGRHTSSQINEAVVRSLSELPPTVTEIVLAELDRL